MAPFRSGKTKRRPKRASERRGRGEEGARKRSVSGTFMVGNLPWMAEMVEVDGSGFGWRFGCGLCGLWVFGDGLGEALGPSWLLLGFFLAPFWFRSGSCLAVPRCSGVAAPRGTELRRNFGPPPPLLAWPVALTAVAGSCGCTRLDALRLLRD